MLVLTRRESERILIPSLGITLQVLSIKGNVIKLGIDAPQEIKILRGELVHKQPPSMDKISSANGQDDVDSQVEAKLEAAVETKFETRVETNAAAVNSPVAFVQPPLQRFVSNDKRRDAVANNVTSKPVSSFLTSPTEVIKESRTAYEVCV